MSKAFTSVLKLKYKQIEAYNSEMHYFWRVKSSSSVQTTSLLLMQSKNLSSRNKALPIAIYDFFTFYTNIPHNKLKNVSRKLINFCFKGGEKQVIVVSKLGATWTDSKNKFRITFDKASLKLSINFLLDNCFFNFGNLSFR